jgi:hypothetical protein
MYPVFSLNMAKPMLVTAVRWLTVAPLYADVYAVLPSTVHDSSTRLSPLPGLKYVLDQV